MKTNPLGVVQMIMYIPKDSTRVKYGDGWTYIKCEDGDEHLTADVNGFDTPVFSNITSFTKNDAVHGYMQSVKDAVANGYYEVKEVTEHEYQILFHKLTYKFPAEKETVLDWLGNDTTAVYKVDEYNYQYPADEYTIKNYMEGKEQTYKCYFMPAILSFGDYDNSCHVERSNVRKFLEEFKDNKWIRHHTGMYSHESIWIDIKCDDEEIIKTLSALADYPAMDDEDVSKMEREMEDEDWDNWIFDDIKRALTKKFESDYDEADEDATRELYEQAKEAANIEYVVQAGGNGWIDVNKIVEHITTPPPRRYSCDQCNMLTINGVATHEHGCPNTNKVYDFDEMEWVTPESDDDELEERLNDTRDEDEDLWNTSGDDEDDD